MRELVVACVGGMGRLVDAGGAYRTSPNVYIRFMKENIVQVKQVHFL